MRIAALALAFCVLAPPAFAQETEAVRKVTLQEAIQIATQNNPILGQARTTLEQTQFTRLSSYGSLLPNVNLGYGYNTSSSGRLDPTGQSITRTSYTMQLGASYNLFQGFRRISDIRSAKLNVHAESARLRQSEFQTILDVKQAFFNSVANRDLVKVEQDRVARQEDQLKFAEQQVQLGRATKSDLLRSQVDLNNAKLALLNAQNSARASTFSLAEVLGTDTRVEPSEEATLEAEKLPFTRTQIMASALRTAPTVASAEAATKAAVAAIASARSAYMPNFAFNGGWAWQASDFPPKNRSWSLSLSGSYPLFNGFQRETQLWQAQTRADAARFQEEAARLALRTNVDAAYNQIEVALTSIDLAKQSVDLSREDLRVTQERYRLGLATILDLQTAQIAVEQAEVDLINRRFDYQIGLAQLESLLGTNLRSGLRAPAR